MTFSHSTHGKNRIFGNISTGKYFQRNQGFEINTC